MDHDLCGASTSRPLAIRGLEEDLVSKDSEAEFSERAVVSRVPKELNYAPNMLEADSAMEDELGHHDEFDKAV